MCSCQTDALECAQCSLPAPDVFCSDQNFSHEPHSVQKFNGHHEAHHQGLSKGGPDVDLEYNSF